MQSDPLITFRRKPANLDINAISGFAEQLRRRVLRGRDFHCVITGDAELARLNKDFRGKNSTTDVLSFPQTDIDGYAGDLAISLGRARAQAREFGHPAATEVCILMLHGVLHLKGMDHEADSGEMARAERRWRKALNLPSGLVERSQAERSQAERSE